MDKKRLLFIQPSQRPYYKDPQKNMFYFMSEHFSGDGVSSLTDRHAGKMDDIEEINSNLPSFTYHLRPRSKLPRVMGILAENFFYLKKGLELSKKYDYEAIVAHPTAMTGVVGLILKTLTGSKLIVEVPTHPTKYFTESAVIPSKLDKTKALVVKYLVNFISNRADMVKLMYPGQMDDFPGFLPKKVDMFFDFVPTSSLPQAQPGSDKGYILLVGTPWYLKGVDFLLKAFDRVAGEYPNLRLKVVGRCPNKEPFKKMTTFTERVEFYDQLPNHEVIRMMAECSIFVLPSRTEGIPRVLQEAMMLSRPVIASNVGGIPQLVKDGENGLLVKKGSVDDLEEKMRTILSNPVLAYNLATNAQLQIINNFSEKEFVIRYKSMVDKLCMENN